MEIPDCIAKELDKDVITGGKAFLMITPEVIMRLNPNSVISWEADQTIENWRKRLMDNKFGYMAPFSGLILEKMVDEVRCEREMFDVVSEGVISFGPSYNDHVGDYLMAYGSNDFEDEMSGMGEDVYLGLT